MQVRIAAAAEQEVDDAVAWYRQQCEGLQYGFLLELRSTIARIQARPGLYRELKPGVRRALLHRYPYSVIYEVSGDLLLILAIGHQHRKPGYWQLPAEAGSGPGEAGLRVERGPFSAGSRTATAPALSCRSVARPAAR